MFKKWFPYMLLLNLALSSLYAAEGHTFKISEEELSHSFLENLNMITPEKLSQIQQESQKTIEKQVNRLPSVKGLLEAKEYAAYFFDPSYKVPENIHDTQGNLIAPKGELVNPLLHIDDLQDLLLIDGNNLLHLDWVQKHPHAKWILVNGNPIQIENQTDHPVFFDQGGAICHHFGIKCIPAKISKANDRLLIEEIPINGKEK